MIPAFRAVFEVTELRARDYFAAIWPAFSASLLMAACVLAIGRLLPDAHHRLIRLTLEASCGALAYAAVMYGVYGDRIRGWVALIKEFRR
jgi:hypothetical protein